MSKPDHQIRPESRAQALSELEAQRPDLHAWLHPLRVTLEALTLDSFRALVPLRAANPAAHLPALHEAVIPIHASALRAQVHAVLSAALGQSARLRIDAINGAQVLELAIAQDDGALSAVAAEAGVDGAALNAAAQLAAVPLLISCARAVAPQPRADWSERYCHVCGALPVFAEVLGLERTRHLRCARCGASWQTQVLVCAFCGERDHAQLGSLVPEGPQGQIAWVETCNTCRGYLKTRAALRSAAAASLLVEDARTLELDLVADEHGYHRPAVRGFHTVVRLAPATGGMA